MENLTSDSAEVDKVLYNLNLAHEIAMNGREIKIEDLLGKNELWSTVKDQIHSAFWDIFRSEIMQNPPVLNMAFMLIKDIKESLFAVMTPNLAKLKAEVEQVLDIELLKQKALHGAVDVQNCAQYVISVMRDICAPARDETIRKISAETDIVAIFRGILETLNLMKLDLINFTLKMITPDILSNQQEYEKKKFEEYLHLVGGKLPITEAWLNKNKEKNLNQNEILYRSFIDVLATNSLPETLFMDAPRLSILKREYSNLILASSVFLIALTSTPQLTDTAYKKTLKNNISILLNGICTNEALKMIVPNLIEQIKKDANMKLNEKGMSGLSESMVCAIERQLKDPENKIRACLAQKINEYLKDSLHSKNVNFPSSLAMFKGELEGLNCKFRQVVHHNIKICGSYYSKILQH